jgi:hypothetical protein
LGRKRHIGAEIISGLTEALVYARGEPVDVRVTKMPSPLEGEGREGVPPPRTRVDCALT